jgi:hypothetical protein
MQLSFTKLIITIKSDFFGTSHVDNFKNKLSFVKKINKKDKLS